ncbi:hypothetical protein [Streptomyces platensis]|uniref:hypothetical protein n=1 Tax=Streptomyces platensis TaxID=58346 RepID=UPI002E266031
MGVRIVCRAFDRSHRSGAAEVVRLVQVFDELLVEPIQPDPPVTTTRMHNSAWSSVR